MTEPNSEFSSESGLDHVDAINKVFAEFEFAYHNQFHKAWNDAESIVIAKKYWLSSLEEFRPEQIIRAAKAIIKSETYLPSLATMVTTCKQGFDLYGLPSIREAYREACSAPSPRKAFPWSHEAVYFAAEAAGWFLLANESESKALPVFEYHYDLLCNRVMAGEKLEIELPQPLPEKIDRPMDADDARARFAKLKKELDL